MASWKAHLVFIDKFRKKETILKFVFPPLYTYNCLYNNLKSLFKTIKWDLIDYPPNYIAFKLTSYSEDSTIITDWDKFIINEDKIQVIIFNPNIYHYALFSQQGEKLMQASSAETIYNDIKIEFVREPLLLYKVNYNGTKIKWIDIIDNPKRMYNEVVIGLIHTYGW